MSPVLLMGYALHFNSRSNAGERVEAILVRFGGRLGNEVSYKTWDPECVRLAQKLQLQGPIRQKLRPNWERMTATKREEVKHKGD